MKKGADDLLIFLGVEMNCPIFTFGGKKARSKKRHIDMVGQVEVGLFVALFIR